MCALENPRPDEISSSSPATGPRENFRPDDPNFVPTNHTTKTDFLHNLYRSSRTIQLRPGRTWSRTDITSSGLRQGCPLSPLLFTVVMDAFSCLVDEGNFKGISCGTMVFSHLLYADDVLVFGEASLRNATTLKEILNSFAISTGLSINVLKSSVLFSSNTTNANDIASLLGFSLTDHSLNYLGLPISIKNLNSTHFQSLLSKLSTLLAGWKVKFLSFAGRIQYLKFTIANSIAYWIRGAILPKNCCKAIDRLCSRFLFHGSSIEKKLHLISWKKTCLPTEFGGLGIPDIQSLSFGFTCSFIWRFYSHNSLTANWFRQKYSSPFKPSPLKASKFWGFTCTVAHKLKQSLKFVVTRDNCILDAVWDPWINGMASSELIQDTGSHFIDVQTLVCDGQWHISGSRLYGISHSILSIPILQDNSGCVEWTGSGKPCFKTFRKLYFLGCEKIRIFVFWSFVARYTFLGGKEMSDVLKGNRRILALSMVFLGNDDQDMLLPPLPLDGQGFSAPFSGIAFDTSCNLPLLFCFPWQPGQVPFECSGGSDVAGYLLYCFTWTCSLMTEPAYGIPSHFLCVWDWFCSLAVKDCNFGFVQVLDHLLFVLWDE
ncbi:hypothetical protein KFK09_006638 [Dendrobium nobile]|uniref:Reverse transcriptase domain-containing protein n=1 Tax=Dendrobium nobile TaxID=94219 RepID=A0A8T3BSY4_DENNO|nr:hypothetical protein KFK09_006638 [Dendrobium nobile]